MSIKEKLGLLEEMFEMEEESLKEDMVLDDIPEWDSMSKLYLVTYVKKNLKRRLTVEEIKKFETVKDICEYLG